MNDDHQEPDDPRPAPPRRYRTLARLENPLTSIAGMTCRDFARLTVTRMDRPLTNGERLRLRFHGVLCRLCRDFAGQFEVINDLVREAASEAGDETDSAALARIRAHVAERVSRPGEP